MILDSASVNEGKTDKVRISFDAPADLAEKIARLKEIHAHKLKDGSLAEVLEMAVDMLLDKTAPENKPAPRKKAQRKVDAPTKSMGIKVEALVRLQRSNEKCGNGMKNNAPLKIMMEIVVLRRVVCR